MKWPLVGRRAFELVLEERDRLRVTNEQLTEHITRLVRTEHGLSEKPRPEKKPVEPMPKAIIDYSMTFLSPSVQKQIRAEAKRRYKEGHSWNSILTTIQADEESTNP